MSGGYFSYSNDNAAREIFGYDVDVNYNLKKHKKDAKKAANDNPLEDHEISELVYDVFCLLHSFDWYKENDTDYDAYREDVAYFKQKWLKNPEERMARLTAQAVERIKRAAQKEIEEIKKSKVEEE